MDLLRWSRHSHDEQAHSDLGTRRVFTGLGLILHDRSCVVVKSSQHFQAAVARAIRYASGPGALSFDYAALPYTKRTKPFWPRVADPFTA